MVWAHFLLALIFGMVNDDKKKAHFAVGLSCVLVKIIVLTVSASTIRVAVVFSNNPLIE